MLPTRNREGPLNYYGNELIPTWWIAAVLFYVCKVAVPLFFMISGALLLGKKDGYRKSIKRIIRILVVLIIFSLAMYLFNEPNPSMVDFLMGLWRGKIRGIYWYLYAYLGMLIMLPLLQKLAAAMSKKDFIYFFVICFAFVNLIPAITPFVPALSYSDSLQLPLFGSYIGMMFAGYYIDERLVINKRVCTVSALIFLFIIVLEVIAVAYACSFIKSENYKVLDDRTITPIVLSACCLFILMKYCLRSFDVERHRTIWPVIFELSSCTFAIYLVHPYFIDLFRDWFKASLDGGYMDLFVLLIYIAAVLACSWPISAIVRRLPGLRRLL